MFLLLANICLIKKETFTQQPACKKNKYCLGCTNLTVPTRIIGFCYIVHMHDVHHNVLCCHLTLNLRLALQLGSTGNYSYNNRNNGSFSLKVLTKR